MFDAHVDDNISLLQSAAFAVALRLCGQNPVILPSGLILLQQRVLGMPMVMLPRAIPPRDIDDQLRDVGLHRLPLILSPEQPCPRPSALRLRGAQKMAQLDVLADADHARAALHPKWRNQLRRAERAGLRVTHQEMQGSADHPLLALETRQARLRRYTNWPAPLTAAFATVAPEQTQLFAAYVGNTPVAYMLFLLHGLRSTYHIGHITERGKSLCAHNLLLWQASRWLADQGYMTLDLGVINPRTSGLNRFKLRTGARVVLTGGTWLRWRPLARGLHP